MEEIIRLLKQVKSCLQLFTCFNGISCNYFIFTNSTSKIKVAFGGMTPPAP